jgi:hypothetical protein
MSAKHYQALIIYIYTVFVLLASLAWRRASRSASFMNENLSASCATIVAYAADDQFPVD